MAHVPYLDPHQVAEGDRELLSRNLNIYRAMIHSPEGARAFQGFGRWIREKSKLAPRLRELMVLQVTYLTQCQYEYSHHVRLSKDAGVTDADIDAIKQETDGRTSKLTPLERDVLRATRELSESCRIEPATFAALKRELDSERLVELVLMISFYNAVVRFEDGLRIDLEPHVPPSLDG
jgi:alkylhydroperoxidase family enzyme